MSPIDMKSSRIATAPVARAAETPAPQAMKSPRATDQSPKPAFSPWEARKSAEDRLRHSDYLELRNVSCDFHDGVLTLRGRVPSYHLKQLAQSLLCELDGILEFNNQLEVVPARESRQLNCRPANFSTPAATLHLGLKLFFFSIR